MNEVRSRMEWKRGTFAGGHGSTLCGKEPAKKLSQRVVVLAEGSRRGGGEQKGVEGGEGGGPSGVGHGEKGGEGIGEENGRGI